MTSRTTLERAYLVLISVLTWLGVVLQLVLGVRLDMAAGRGALFGVVQTLSFFTVLTNILVALVATAALKRSERDTFLARPSTMSAIAAYIFVVGVVYSLLLRNVWDPTGLQAVLNITLHDVVPILYVVYWLVFVPKGTLRWEQPAMWLIYPLLYFIYSLARGMATGRYPYPFADVGKLGYSRIFLNTAVILMAFWVIGLIVVAIDRSAERSVRWGGRTTT